jgi:NADH-quinone oxidoreductase subunit J
MTFQTVFFYAVALLAIGSALLMILQRNPLMSVLTLIVNFFALAVLYLTLHAQFIAVVQVIVYAGAIMVLFLFVIMLLNLGDEQSFAERTTARKIVGILLAATVLLQIVAVVTTATSGSGETTQSFHAVEIGTIQGIGKALFTQYLLPFEIASVLLLAAMVGVIVLAKKRMD